MSEAGSAQPKIGAATEPLRNYQFVLDVPGLGDGRFTECSGLAVRVHPIRYREGGAGQVVRTLPGRVDYTEACLRYGLSASAELWKWLARSTKGAAERRNVSIIVLSPDGMTQPVRWNLLAAWPCEWRGASFDALGNDVAIEELRLSYESLERA